MESAEQIKFLPTEKTKSQDLIYKNLLPPSYDFNLHDTGTNDSEKLSLLVKMSFGYGGIGQYLYALVFGFFMSPFLLQVAGLPAISAGVIQSIVAVYGALINPIIGFLSDLSPHPRRISWIAFSTIPFSYAYFMFWLVPPFESEGWKIAYYFTIYALLSTLFACFVVPYNSLSAEITLSYDERTKLSGYRWVLSLSIGTLAIIAQAVLIFAFPEGDGDFNLEKGYALAGLVVAVILITPGAVLLLFVKERDLLNQKKVKTGILTGIKITMSNYPFLFVVAINSCSWAALTFLTNNLFLYVDYVLGESIYFPIVISLILGICTISLPIWAWLTAKYGKKLVYFAGTFIIIIALFPTTFLTADQVNLMFFLSAIGGCGLGVLYLIPYSMVPDVVEMDELRTGERREGSFFSIFIFFERLATGISMLISGIVLQNTNYNASEEDQPAAVITALQVMVGTIPPIILMLSWIACYYYPITRQVHAQILNNLGEKQILSVNHHNVHSSASSESSDNA